MAIHKQNFPAGFPQETREGLTAKRSYSSPTITSVEFAVEIGVGESTLPNSTNGKWYLRRTGADLNNEIDQSSSSNPLKWEDGEQNWL